MPIFIPNPSPTIHDSCQSYIIFHYIHVSHHNIHTQTNINHPRINKHPNNVLPRPAPRSGGTCSLRRAPIRLGEGSKEHPETNVGSRLGETPLTWARCSLAQKFSRSLGRPFAQTGLGESLSISPRRDWLAWTRLAGLTTVFLQQSPHRTKPTHSCVHR